MKSRERYGVRQEAGCCETSARRRRAYAALEHMLSIQGCSRLLAAGQHFPVGQQVCRLIRQTLLQCRWKPPNRSKIGADFEGCAGFTDHRAGMDAWQVRKMSKNHGQIRDVFPD